MKIILLVLLSSISFVYTMNKEGSMLIREIDQERLSELLDYIDRISTNKTLQTEIAADMYNNLTMANNMLKNMQIEKALGSIKSIPATRRNRGKKEVFRPNEK